MAPDLRAIPLRFVKSDSEQLSPELLFEIAQGALNDDDSWVRMYAAEALAKLGDKSVIPRLIEVIGDDNQDSKTKLEVM